MSKIRKVTNKPRLAGTALRAREADPIELVAAPPSSDFLRFHYSCTEISSQGGRTHLRSRQTRLEDGKLSSETFEGELAGDAYGQAVQQAQRQLLEHMATMLRPFGWWLPSLAWKRSDQG